MKFLLKHFPEGSTTTSRCDVCHGPLTVVVRDGNLVDSEDETRHVDTSRGHYVHSRCDRDPDEEF